METFTLNKDDNFLKIHKAFNIIKRDNDNIRSKLLKEQKSKWYYKNELEHTRKQCKAERKALAEYSIHCYDLKEDKHNLQCTNESLRNKIVLKEKQINMLERGLKLSCGRTWNYQFFYLLSLLIILFLLWIN